MNISNLVDILGARVHTCQHKLDIEIHSACGADLMSDVIAFVKDDVVLLTGLINIQTIRSAILLDIPVIVFVRGKLPNQEMLDLAEENGIVLLSTRLSLFLACGKLYEAGLRAGGTREIS